MAIISPDVAVARSPNPERRFSIKGLFNKDKPPTELPRLPEFTNEPDAVEHFFKLQGQDARAIATLSFIKQSQESYNSAWLTRELVQNFVDHNPQAPGTLNGVRFEEQTLPNGSKRFVITGNWPFIDNTGVVTLHSDKPEGRNTAGGNGIGLKQAAIRLMRDFGVNKFQIQGERWTANYQVAKGEDVNQKWQSMPNLSPIPRFLLKNDWLIVNVQKTSPTGSCSYIIETANPEMINALGQFPTLGVSRENPYLKDMDYTSQYGAIKWLPKTQDGQLGKGRLFINGQVMNFKKKGESATDYWVGPEGVTIQLNNQRYEMNIDRPPIATSTLGMDLLAKLVGGMSAEEALKQLQKSEYIWAGYKPKRFFDREGADVVIGVIVNGLSHNPNFSRADYEKYFPNRKYLANDHHTANDSQLRELQEQGYIICPDYFASMGMPKLSSKLAPKEHTYIDKVPMLTHTERERIAQEIGMEVGFEDFFDLTKPIDFFILLKNRLAGNTTGIEVNPQDPNIIKISLRDSIPQELLFHALPKPRTEQQKYLYFLRGVAAYGLEKAIFNRVLYHQGDFITTFASDYDEVTQGYNLTVRNINNEGDESSYLQLELNDQYAEQFKAAWEKTAQSQPTTTKPTGTAITPPETEQIQQWTPEEERLYQLARQKRPEELTEEDKLAIQKKGALAARFGAVPIVHAPEPEREFHGQIIPKQATLSDQEKIRLAQMEQNLPGIVEATNKLDELIPTISPQVSADVGEIGKYLDWRESSGYYGRIADLSTTAGYITGKHLLDLVNEYNQAEIDVVEAHREKSPGEQTLVTLKDKLQGVVDRIVPKEDNVEEFDLVYDPTPAQLGQLGLLRIYTRVVTGVELPNDLFIYRGTGSKGINLGQKAIGVHEALLHTQFSEVLETFAHEVAHNQEMLHFGPDWYKAFGALLVKMVSRISEIARKDPSERTQEEKSIISISEIWDGLRSQQAAPPPTLPSTSPALGS